MATNMSLKEQIKARKAAVDGFLSIPVEKSESVQAVGMTEDKSKTDSALVQSKEKSVYKLGFKGYIELALRTGQSKLIIDIEVYDGEPKQ